MNKFCVNVILVLGAAMWSTGPSPAMKRRVSQAVKNWRNAPDSWVIPCGGVGNFGQSEGQEMQCLLIESGVDKNTIIPECHSTSTYENIKFSLPIVRLLNPQSITIVTDDFHAKRALQVADHFELNAAVSAASTSGVPATIKTKAIIRESLARQVYRAKLLRQKPKNWDL